MNDSGQTPAKDASRVLYKFVIAVFLMEEIKESLAFKGIAERLTLGITRILGVYHRFCFETSELANRLMSLWAANISYEFVPVVPENMPGVVDVRFVEREPAEKRSLLSWEQVKHFTPQRHKMWSGFTLLSYEPALFLPQKNTCILPEDLRDFYLTTDGFTLTWSVKLDSR